MDLQEFQMKYGTERQCLEYLFHVRWPYGYRCPRCGNDEMWQIGDYKYKCRGCGYQTSAIAGTLFQDTHVPLQLWFRGIYYVSTQLEKATTQGLQQALSLGSNHTACKMMRKIKSVWHTQAVPKLCGRVEADICEARIAGRAVHLAVCVELCQKKLGRIHIEAVTDSSASTLYSIITRCIAPGSRVLCVPGGEDVLTTQGYLCDKARYGCSFSRARKIATDFQIWMNHTNPQGSMEECLRTYCAKVNSPKMQISFYELLENAVHSPPRQEQ